MSKTELIILSLSFAMALSFVAVEGYGRMVGGRTEVTDVKTNKQVQKMGRFAVEEYNRNHRIQRRRFDDSEGRSVELVFSEVIEAETQVVSGIKYYLKIEATENKLRKTFESVVVVKPWLQSKELLHFSPSTR
ncbi:Tetratricopeptide repeat (TPR)-like superfamily protein isoform 1 [Hibiscus syriacus]|uniref:Tetratricopeptide repeat (TPR)-like superfamily protein isoform 1 n=1 Tax=Hibiscus syriacus TaxID=106335 RepID=A0A6A2ZVE6_HIBSY|nr:Tetratricopeptide repeat (TPR)-like superfamily protein isoform 1 [Hibiscus syriacus]